MHAHLPLLLALLTTAIAAVPPKCGSSHPTFTLKPINFSSYYIYLNPAHLGPVSATFGFLLKNDETDYNIECKGSMSDNYGEFRDYRVFKCSMPGDKDWEVTSFTFDSYSKIVAVNTTWDCGGDIVYVTSVKGQVDLKCRTERWVNPNWKFGNGEQYSNTSTSCEPASLVILL